MTERHEERRRSTYVVDVVARDGNDDVLNTKREIGQVGIAVKDPATKEGGLGSTRDLSIVCLDDSGGQVDQGGSGVGDTDDGRVNKVITDTVSGGGEFPVAGQLVHGGVREIAAVGGVVDPTDIVGAG